MDLRSVTLIVSIFNVTLEANKIEMHPGDKGEKGTQEKGIVEGGCY